MKKILSLITAIALSVAALGVVTSCSDGTKINGNCKTGWKVVQYETKNTETGETETENQFVCFKVDYDSDNVNEVWINVGAMDLDEVEVTVSRYSSGTDNFSDVTSTRKSFTVKKDEVRKGDNGWICVQDDYNVASSYIKVALNGGMQINEVVFIDTQGKQLEVSVYGAKMIYKADGKVYGDIYKEAELKELGEVEGGTPFALVDEQDKFDARK